MDPVRVRIAPSPTGDPHVGTAYVALFNWLLARQTKGQFILRIEDTDRTRSTKESEDAILRALHWLKLDYDEGPDVGGPCGPYRQSERSAIYRDHVDRLLASGHAYCCFCTEERLENLRGMQKAAKVQPGYDGKCRALDADEVRKCLESRAPHVVRLKIDKSATTSFHDLLRGEIKFDNHTIDDQVLLKSDGFPTYHLANVVDDHLMKITHVLRAEEWIPSTPKHVLLYRAFGWQEPAFCHLPLLRNADKTKISKRKNPTSLDYYRTQGYLPEAIVNFLALMGFSPTEGEGEEVFSMKELEERFRLEKVSLGGPVFDLTKLDWLNGAWIRRLPKEGLADRIAAFLPAGHPASRVFLLSVIPLIQERLKKLSELDEWTDFFFKDVAFDSESFRRCKETAKVMVEVLNQSADLLEQNPSIETARDEERLRELCGRMAVKVGNFFMTLRVAVTGKSATPPLVDSMRILGKEKSVARLRQAARWLVENDKSRGDL